MEPSVVLLPITSARRAPKTNMYSGSADYEDSPNNIEVSSSSGSAATNVSRLIDEENIVESVFHACDVDKTGLVPVDSLVDYVKCTTDHADEGAGHIAELGRMLRTEARDGKVDISSYRSTMASWINRTRQQQRLIDFSSDSDADASKSPLRSPRSSLSSHRSPGTDRRSSFLTPLSPKRNQVYPDLVSSTSTPLSSPLRTSQLFDMVNERSQFTSSPVQGTSSRPSLADLTTSTRTDAQELHFQNKRLAEANQELRAQLEANEETIAKLSEECCTATKQLKSQQHLTESLQLLQEEAEDLKTTLSTKEEENQWLKSKLVQKEREHASLIQRAGQLEDKLLQCTSDLDLANEQHQISAADCKRLQSVIDEVTEQREVILRENLAQVEELQQTLTNLRETVKSLTDEKVELEEKVANLQCEQNIKQHEQMSQVQIQFAESGFPVTPVLRAMVSTHTSTPVHYNNSLCAEIRHSTFKEESGLSLPICDKELEGDITSADEEIHEILSQSEGKAHSSCDVEVRLDSLAPEECDSSMNKIKSTLSSVKEECATIYSSYQQLVALLEKEAPQSATASDGLKQLCGGREPADWMHEQTTQWKTSQLHLNNSLEAIQRLFTKATQLSQTVDDLKRANSELECKNKDAEARITDMHEQLHKAAEAYSQEREHAEKLKENLDESCLQHQLDLKELWRLVYSTDLDNDYPADAQETPITVSTDSIKDQVAKEIEALRSTLFKKEAELKALSKKKVLPTYPLPEFENGKNNNICGSPLIEALSLDKMESQTRSGLPPAYPRKPPPYSRHASPIIPTRDSYNKVVNGTPQSPTDPEDPLLRYRTSSFRKAIRNQYGDQDTACEKSLRFSDLVQREGELQKMRPPEYVVARAQVYRSSPLGTSPNTMGQEHDGSDTWESLNWDYNTGDEWYHTADSHPPAGCHDTTNSQAYRSAAWRNRRLSTLTEEGVELADREHAGMSGRVGGQPADKASPPRREQPPGYKTPPSYQRAVGLAQTSNNASTNHPRTFSPPVRDTDNQPAMQPTQFTESLCKVEKIAPPAIKSFTDFQPPGPGSMKASLKEAVELRDDNLDNVHPAAEASKKTDMAEGSVDKETSSGTTSDQSGNNLAQKRAENLLKRRIHCQQGRMAELVEREDSPAKEDSSPSPSPSPSTVPSLHQLLDKLAQHNDDRHSPTPDEFGDKEIEEKFTSLSLAFKTDKQTLQRRIELQERSRDVAEQNLNKELTGLKEALKLLGQHCVDSEVQQIYLRVQRHVEVLDQALGRLCSRAETLGAVQQAAWQMQEKRMSSDMEGMVQYVESLKRAFEREHSELEEAKRLLQESKVLGPVDDMQLPRRNAMLNGGTVLGKDSRSRLQSIIGDTRTKATVVKELRRSLSPDARSSTHTDSIAPRKRGSIGDLRTTLHAAEDLSVGASHEVLPMEDSSSLQGTAVNTANNISAKSQQDNHNAFQKGFEEGVRVRVGRDLANLKEQQASLSNSLEEMIEKADKANEDEVEGLIVRLQQLYPGWSGSRGCLRYFVAGVAFMMAVFSLLFTLIPTGSACERQHYSACWAQAQRILKPFLEVRHYGPPPT